MAGGQPVHPLNIFRDDDLLYPLPDFGNLHRTGFRMNFNLSPFGPLVGVVMMIDMAEQEAGIGLVDNKMLEEPVNKKRPGVRLRSMVRFSDGEYLRRPLHLIQNGTLWQIIYKAGWIRLRR